MLGRILPLILLSTAAAHDAPRPPDVVSYLLDPTISADSRSAILAAFHAWSAAIPVRFQECAAPEIQKCVAFRFVPPSHGDLAPFSFVNRSLAHTVFRGDIPYEVHFNRDLLLEERADASGLYWVALHEIGHIIGIPHSADPRSIMFPNRRKSEAQQGILASDREAFESNQKPEKHSNIPSGTR